MSFDRAPLLLALLLGLALSAGGAGCVLVHHDHAVTRSGPPPWAPAHGYRHKHRAHGVELVFDAPLGVYAVVGMPGLYFHHDHYLRLHAGSWQQSPRLGGPWLVVSAEHVPPGLQRQVAQGKRGKGRRGKR